MPRIALCVFATGRYQEFLSALAESARRYFHVDQQVDLVALTDGDTVPEGPTLTIFGFVNAFLSALMGIGGGQLATMFMTFYGRTIHQAVATSSGVGVLISIPGAIGFVLAGWDKPFLPPLSLGFVSLIGLAAFAPVSVLTAPLGVRIAHALTKRKLEMAFGISLLLVSLRLLSSMLG